MALKKIDEKFIQWIWGNKKVVGDFKTVSGNALKIIFQGVQNFEDGPDFKDAIITLNGELKGDIEIHLSSTDWFSHKHNTDPKYNNVILHIVLAQENIIPVITSENKKIETFVLSRWLQKPLEELYEEFTVSNAKIEICPYRKHMAVDKITEVILHQGIARFNVKKQKFANLMRTHSREQAVYIGVMEALGYVKNKAPFIKLANYIPIETLKRLTSGKEKSESIEIIKAILLGAAGFIAEDIKDIWDLYEEEKFQNMNKSEWQFFKVRPRGFPQYRIRSISPFLADAVKYGICNLLKDLNNDNLKCSTTYISLSQGKFGKSYIDTIILNVFLPVLSILSSNNNVMEIYKNYKSLPPNNITDFMSKLLLSGKSSKQEIYNQGLLHIFHQNCKDRKCNTCYISGKV